MPSRPLHVQVAEALGWTECVPFEADGIVDYGNWVGDLGDDGGFVPEYDTDWSATGPLIERLGIDLWEKPLDVPGKWGSSARGHHGEVGFGSTPLIAVCNLILALHASGKLPDAHE